MVATSLSEKICGAITPILTRYSYTLVDLHAIRLQSGYQITITLYRPQNLTASDLGEIHKILYPHLMVELDDRDISLTLSTPGLRYRLCKDIHYEIFAGKRVNLLTKPHNQWQSGALVGKRGGRIVIKADDSHVQEYDQDSVIKTVLNEEVPA